jgi:hypothetical protein
MRAAHIINESLSAFGVRANGFEITGGSGM